MTGFTFEQETHIYKLNNRPLPTVTQSIQSNFGTRDYYTEWHRDKGRAVHLAIHYLINNQLDFNSLDERIKPRIEAFEKFIRETRFKIVHSELQLYSKRYQFAGTIDLILEDEKGLILGDIKSSIEPIVEIQLGGYGLLWEENYNKSIKKSVAIELKDNGDFNTKWFNNLKKGKRLFLSNLTMSNFKREHNYE